MQENCFRLIGPVISCILVGYYVQIIHQKTQTKVWVLFLFLSVLLQTIQEIAFDGIQRFFLFFKSIKKI